MILNVEYLALCTGYFIAAFMACNSIQPWISLVCLGIGIYLSKFIYTSDKKEEED